MCVNMNVCLAVLFIVANFLLRAYNCGISRVVCNAYSTVHCSIALLDKKIESSAGTYLLKSHIHI
jgi:hypothetical protein